MKCITCNKEIPDASTTCPFCNNKVEPVISASEALGVSSVLPTTPTYYKLPKEQQAINNETPSTPVTTTDILPPAPPSLDEDESSKAEEIGATIPTPPTPEVPMQEQQTNSQPAVATSNAVDVSSYNIENLDLNANANAQSLDLTKENINNEKETKKQKKSLKSLLTKRNIIIGVILLVVIGLVSGGVWFYKKEFKSASVRIQQTINRLFTFSKNLKNDNFKISSGSYKLSYAHGNDDNKISFDIDGKFGYNIQDKKIDLIANIKNYIHDNIVLDKEINSEIYLEDNKVYLLLQNFSDNYIYTDINESYTTIKDIENRFNNPNDLFLFNNLNTVYDNFLDKFAANYATYLDNASKNDVNYLNIINGLKTAITNSLASMPSTQKMEGGNNVIRINLNDKNKVKSLCSNIYNKLKSNSSAYGELQKIFGDDLTTYFDNFIENYEFKPINGDIVIVTDLFKGNLKYISIPTLKDDKVVNTKITPIANGYKIVSTIDSKEIINITYNKANSSTSTVQTTTYKITGKTNFDDKEKDLNISLELSKDINPQPVEVITRNSLNYKYLTANDFNEIAGKISEYGTLGELFKNNYKGIVEDIPLESTEGGE